MAKTTANRESQGNKAAIHLVMWENIELIVLALGDIIAQWVEEAVAQNPN